MNEKITYTTSAMAVGMSISFLSMLQNSDYNFHVEVDSEHHSLIPLKKIFNIPDDRLTISVTDDMSANIFWELSDVGKLTSPYLSPEFVNIRSQQMLVNARDNKPCVALACYQDYTHLQNYDATDLNWPNNRYWSVDEYGKIFQLIKNAGYEVVTLDNHAINLEDKVYWLNEYCDAVIGYEGGLCHLAHTLKIPTIILPWRPSQSFLNIDSLHLDTRTFFVREFDEILNWSKFDLLDTLELLKNQVTNNTFYTGKVTFAKDLSEYRIQTTEREYSMLAGFRPFESDFFLNKLKSNTIFGNPIKYFN
jgi:hypothetical protein